MSSSVDAFMWLPPPPNINFVFKYAKSLKEYFNQISLSALYIMYFTVCTVLYCTVLCCTVLYCTVLYCSGRPYIFLNLCNFIYDLLKQITIDRVNFIIFPIYNIESH